MGKIKRAARTVFPRAATTSRTKSNDDHLTRSSPTRRGTSRMVPDGRPDADKLAASPPDDGVLDEWLEPDEDADLDQWLHDHSAEGGIDDPES
jgi:hypothetical protein